MRNLEQETLKGSLDLTDLREDLEGELILETIVEHYEEPEEAAGRTVYRQETDVISQTWHLDGVEISEEDLLKKFGKEDFNEIKAMIW